MHNNITEAVPNYFLHLQRWRAGELLYDARLSIFNGGRAVRNKCSLVSTYIQVIV